MRSIFPIDVNGKNTSPVWRFGWTLTGGSSPSAPGENRLWPCPRRVSLPLKCLFDLNKRAMSRLWKEKGCANNSGKQIKDGVTLLWCYPLQRVLEFAQEGQAHILAVTKHRWLCLRHLEMLLPLPKKFSQTKGTNKRPRQTEQNPDCFMSCDTNPKKRHSNLQQTRTKSTRNGETQRHYVPPHHMVGLTGFRPATP